ncbi:MAG: BON domain-containing protein [Thiohalomonadaceae bacterium]
MSDEADAVKEFCARLERDVHVNLSRNPIHAEFRGGVLHLTGEVEDIVVKRRIAHVAAEMFGQEGVQDLITVSPAQAREDGAIRDSLLRTLLEEPVFRRFGINVWSKGEMYIERDVRPDSEGHLDLVIDGGVVTLSGEVWSLSHRRMAELITWWVPGVRGVINHIAINPPEEDTDDDITDSVRFALDKDPLVVHSSQIRVTTRDGQVRLEGLVPQPEERQMAEQDVWYLGTEVAEVENLIKVRPVAMEGAGS